ncbi:MAG: protein kinase [Planctomycetes bacterium]|nr:protein kinase [Planctomycetota bacterium]
MEEAKSLSRIHHANIVRILSTGRMKNGESFLVMDFVAGLTATQLGKAGRLWIPEALQIASDMCDALQAVHDKGMVHRDVKPSNVMIEEKTNRTVLIDFSLALTEGGGLAGSAGGDDHLLRAGAGAAPERERRHEPGRRYLRIRRIALLHAGGGRTPSAGRARSRSSARSWRGPSRA